MQSRYKRDYLPKPLENNISFLTENTDIIINNEPHFKNMKTEKQYVDELIDQYFFIPTTDDLIAK